MRFKPESNLIFTCKDVDDLLAKNGDKLLTFFNLHREQQQPRLQELLDYYLTNNRGINRREGRDEPYADYRIAHAFVKNGTDFIRGYIGGNEITFRDDQYNDEIQDINDLNDAHVTNVEILEDCIIYGRAYEIVYRNADNQDIFKRLDPKNVFVIYSDDIDVEPIAAVRYRAQKLQNKDVTLIDLYTASYRAYFYIDDNCLIARQDMPQEVNMHQMLQIHEYNANRFRQGVFENVLDLIDAYDYAESDTANYMTDLNDAMLKIEGNLDLKLEEVKKMRKSRIILAKTKADSAGRMGNANVDFIYKQYDVAGVEAYKKRIQKDIHKFTNTPDLSDENFGGVQSGEAMKYKLFGLEQLRSTIERQLTKGFKRRFAIIQSVRNQLNDPIDLSHMRIEYKPNIPQSLSEYADIYKNLLAYYGKLATSEGIDWQQAKQIADKFDVEAFQMQAKAYVENKDFSDKANKELKRYNTAMYVNREQLLKHELGLIVTKGYAEQENVINKHLHDSVTRTLEHQSGILGADVYVKPTDIDAIVNANFGDVKWSKRLWENQAQLQKDVERMASNVMLRGRHPHEFVPEIRKKHQQTTFNTKRLLITEAARVQTEGQRLYYLKSLGDDAEYQFVAKMDEKTSQLCRVHNNKVYKVKDMVPGVNAPPLHPFCRSTTVPHVGNWREKFFKDRQGKYKAEHEKVTQMLAKKEMTAAIESGKIKVELNVDKQNRHQLGHKLYEDYKKKNLQKGKSIPSFTQLDNSELNSLIAQKAGKGRLLTDTLGNWYKKEVINFGKNIGEVYTDGRFMTTKWGKMHYSKTGTHVIPKVEEDKQ